MRGSRLRYDKERCYYHLMNRVAGGRKGTVPYRPRAGSRARLARPTRDGGGIGRIGRIGPRTPPPGGRKIPGPRRKRTGLHRPRAGSRARLARPTRDGGGIGRIGRIGPRTPPSGRNGPSTETAAHTGPGPRNCTVPASWIARIPQVYANSVLGTLAEVGLGIDADPNCIAKLRDYRSLMPLALEARKPMFFLKAADGALGAHTYAVADAHRDFSEVARRIAARIGLHPVG